MNDPAAQSAKHVVESGLNTLTTSTTAAPTATNDDIDCLSGGGEMGVMMRATDWSVTPVGPVSGWSPSLRTMVGLVLRNRFPLSLWWGPELVQFYNDPFIPTLGAKHPAASGQSGRACWAEIWNIIGPMIEGPFAGGPATGSEDLSLLIHRRGFFEETHFRVAYSPVPDETVAGTGIGGVLATVSETTAQVQGERQLRTLRELGNRAATAQSAADACRGAAAILGHNAADVPFSLFYLLDGGSKAVLTATSGFAADDVIAAAPATIDLATLEVSTDHPSRDSVSSQTVSLHTTGAASLWRLRVCLAERRIEVIDGLDERFGTLPNGAWAAPPCSAIVLPLASPDQEHPYGVMIAGLNPHRRLDDRHQGFFELAAAQVVTAIRNARAFEVERARVAALAQLDQAKTTFFSNVSHEFRTPLALMIAPTEDALASPGRSLEGEALEMVHRNELRLLKLVNSLLDFSRMEAGRVEASFQPTDLMRLTVDLASQFRAAMEKGGLQLIVDAPPLPAPAHVDRDMWEKIVMNLLSNAFKHTFEGAVRVGLAVVDDTFQLTVRDSGIGITADELPRIFDRFHRVRGARTRSHEGTGIGLALVRDLVQLHGGRIDAESEAGVGTCMTVSIPVGSAHLPAERVGATRSLTSTAVSGAAYVNDALSWLPSGDPARSTLALSAADRAGLPLEGRSGAEAGNDVQRARLVLADDNADMREYLRRLLSTQWTVEAVADGDQALAAIQRSRPDLVVADVMMPGLDGLALTRALRADPLTQALPILLLSARSGDAATDEGLAAGANDYVTKPFSGRELVARVRVQLEIARSHDRARALASMQVDAEQARRLDLTTRHAKDEFLAVLSHELRNPLAPILTALELMKEHGDAGASERGIIERNVKHVVRLIDDLLDVSRITRSQIRLHLEQVNVAAIVDDALAQAASVLAKHVVAVDVEAGLSLTADPFRLTQILSNLLTNAARFTPAGGSIKVSASRERPGDDVVLRVADNGRGIEPALLASVFEVFVQHAQASDRAAGGLGVGLTIVKGLAQLHGGTVEAHSAGTGQGSELVVRLPARARARLDPGSPLQGRSGPGARSAATPVNLQAEGGPLRVLVVDDNEDAASLLSVFLRRDGHDVVVAHDGFEALAARATFVPDVALLDIGLPGMDGFELARSLRSLYPGVPLKIIAVSGYGEQRDRANSKAAGFDEHLVKPVDLARLGELLTEAPRASTLVH